MEFKDCQCSQCGAKDFTEVGNDKLRCNYCDSLFFKPNGSEEGGGVTIRKGAKVVFKPSANVTIRGKLNIEDGANVEFGGNITLIKKGDERKIKKAKLRLKK